MEQSRNVAEAIRIATMAAHKAIWIATDRPANRQAIDQPSDQRSDKASDKEVTREATRDAASEADWGVTTVPPTVRQKKCRATKMSTKIVASKKQLVVPPEISMF